MTASLGTSCPVLSSRYDKQIEHEYTVPIGWSYQSREITINLGGSTAYQLMGGTVTKLMCTCGATKVIALEPNSDPVKDIKKSGFFRRR